VIITVSAADVDKLAQLAEAEARSHAPRTPARRAAATLRAALVTTVADSASEELTQ
jgi:hypothetical protein